MNKNVATLETKAELKSEEDKITELQVFDAGYFRGKSHFEDDGTQKLFSISANVKKLSLLLHLIIVLLFH